MYIFKCGSYLGSISFQMVCIVLEPYVPLSMRRVCYPPTVKSRVTQGVIICDVEMDMASYHTHTLSKIHTQHLCTAIWSLVHKCMTPTMCVYVFVCLLSYGWVPPQSHGLSEYSLHVGTVHNTARPCRPLPCLPVPSDLDRGQSSRPSKQYTARPRKTTIAPQCIPLVSLGTPVFVQSLRSQREAVWRDY